MGIYINKGNGLFRQSRNSEYIDKSGLIAVVNQTLFTRQRYTCVTRSRRFGKSMAAEMLAAYYDKSCDSRSLFADLQIAQHPTFEEHLNKYAVIYLDLSAFAMDLGKRDIVDRIMKKLIGDIKSVYPKVPVPRGGSLMDYLQRIHTATGDTFFFIVDEWDAILREAVTRAGKDGEAIKDAYVNWLRSMFKNVAGMDVFAGVYMTGILPIKKYDTQSAMNNFEEYSMVEPGDMGRYFGFTKDEVQTLAAEHQMDFDELEKWYDGYQIGDQPSMFNPNSVMQAVTRGRCRSFWASTGAFDTVAGYIKMDFDTGQPVNDAPAMLHPLLNFLSRLHRQYGINEFLPMQEAGERWMREVPLKSFDMEGQFEDVSVMGLQPYENLTNCTAAPYADYLLRKEDPTEEDISNAIDLIRLSEDQFVHWDYPLGPDDIHKRCAPAVHEQYKYETPIDNSSCNVANAMLSLYEKTGDRLMLAKAKALIDHLTVMQHQNSGVIPTAFVFRPVDRDIKTQITLNCCYADVLILMRMHRLMAAEAAADDKKQNK